MCLESWPGLAGLVKYMAVTIHAFFPDSNKEAQTYKVKGTIAKRDIYI